MSMFYMKTACCFLKNAFKNYKRSILVHLELQNSDKNTFFQFKNIHFYGKWIQRGPQVG